MEKQDIVPPEDSEETANVIEKLLKSEVTRNELGKNARNRINDLYNWKKNVDLMNSIYLNCIKNNNKYRNIIKKI